VGYEYGPGGDRSGTGTDRVDIPVGKVLVADYKVITGNYFSAFAWVPNSAEQPRDVQLKAWVSATPDGDPLQDARCAKTTGLEDSLYIDQTNAIEFACQIPNAAATYFLNMVLCNTVATDKTCSANGVQYADKAGQIFLSNNLSQ
jgi:hypothetical protein